MKIQSNLNKKFHREPLVANTHLCHLLLHYDVYNGCLLSSDFKISVMFVIVMDSNENLISLCSLVK